MEMESCTNEENAEGTSHKVEIRCMTDVKGGSMNDRTRHSREIPIKRRRNFHRRNSFIIPKRYAQRLANNVLCSLEPLATDTWYDTSINDDFHASWSTPDDTRCFLEFSVLSLSTSTSSSANNEGLGLTDCATSLSANSTELHRRGEEGDVHADLLVAPTNDSDEDTDTSR
ncbi:hypothetical protein IV203_029108 [Nitzschia inconspicua]|uniref:Uncharacterized protein n=1 Tax=Nitzschia inconspicua TaxID=303405 RepID=A0A9K3LR33_9STRA|nr:hypothetical protein IV203_029108 [Nitzschia inconspicua]